MVRVLVSNGVAHRIIAEVLDISTNTFRKHYKLECKNGFERIKAQIGAAVVSSALAGNVAAQKYWLGTHGGPEWRVPKEEQGGTDLIDPVTGTLLEHHSDDPWVIMMPENGRDRPDPEIDSGPVIEGKIDKAA
jgi:hypothetical protein